MTSYPISFYSILFCTVLLYYLLISCILPCRTLLFYVVLSHFIKHYGASCYILICHVTLLIATLQAFAAVVTMLKGIPKGKLEQVDLELVIQMMEREREKERVRSGVEKQPDSSSSVEYLVRSLIHFLWKKVSGFYIFRHKVPQSCKLRIQKWFFFNVIIIPGSDPRPPFLLYNTCA